MITLKTVKQLLKILFTISGFIVAILVNVLFPQKADVTFKIYTLNILNLRIAFDINSAYIVVLVALILIYAISGIRSIFQKDKRKLYAKNAAFRFALGIALAIWDIGGTKLQIFAQPFFPGPAQIIEAYLAEGSYIVQNTLYSIRLYLAGFSCGVLLGVGTGILIGWFPKVYYWVFPVLKITGVVPAVAWMPFALTLFPTSFSAAVFLIVICAWFQIAFLTAQGIQSTPKQSYEAATVLGGRADQSDTACCHTACDAGYIYRHRIGKCYGIYHACNERDVGSAGRSWILYQPVQGMERIL